VCCSLAQINNVLLSLRQFNVPALQLMRQLRAHFSPMGAVWCLWLLSVPLADLGFYQTCANLRRQQRLRLKA
jgi:hypothetical protein